MSGYQCQQTNLYQENFLNHFVRGNYLHTDYYLEHED